MASEKMAEGIAVREKQANNVKTRPIYGEMGFKATNLNPVLMAIVMTTIGADFIVNGWLPYYVEAVFHRDHGLMITVTQNQGDRAKRLKISASIVQEWTAAAKGEEQ